MQINGDIDMMREFDNSALCVTDFTKSFRQLPAKALRVASELDSMPGTPGIFWDKNGRGDKYAKLSFYLSATGKQYAIYLGKMDDASFNFLKTLVDKRRETGRRQK